MIYGMHQQDKIKQMRGSFLLMFRYETLVSNPFLSEPHDEKSEYLMEKASFSGMTDYKIGSSFEKTPIGPHT